MKYFIITVCMTSLLLISACEDATSRANAEKVKLYGRRDVACSKEGVLYYCYGIGGCAPAFGRDSKVIWCEGSK